MSQIQIRINEKDKEEARKVFDKLGLDMSSAIKLFLRQTVLKNGLPFDVSNDSRVEQDKQTEDSDVEKRVVESNTELSEFLKSRKYLFWDVHLESLNKEAVVERVLNYGDWDDVQLMFQIIGIKKVSTIFHKQIEMPRNNYRNSIKNYYNLYFKKYA